MQHGCCKPSFTLDWRLESIMHISGDMVKVDEEWSFITPPVPMSRTTNLIGRHLLSSLASQSCPLGSSSSILNLGHIEWHSSRVGSAMGFKLWRSRWTARCSRSCLHMYLHAHRHRHIHGHGQNHTHRHRTYIDIDTGIDMDVGRHGHRHGHRHKHGHLPSVYTSAVHIRAHQYTHQNSMFMTYTNIHLYRPAHTHQHTTAALHNGDTTNEINALNEYEPEPEP